MSFRKQNLMNFQIQLTKRQGIVPMTRDYIAREEARLRGMELGKPAAAAVRRRIGRLNRGGFSSAGCKPRHKAHERRRTGQLGAKAGKQLLRHRATARSSGREISSMVSISIDSQSVWPLADRHP